MWWKQRRRSNNTFTTGNQLKLFWLYFALTWVMILCSCFIYIFVTFLIFFLYLQNLIDLAGSESSKAETTGMRRREGSYINKSLLTLGTVRSQTFSSQCMLECNVKMFICFPSQLKPLWSCDLEFNLFGPHYFIKMLNFNSRWAYAFAKL